MTNDEVVAKFHRLVSRVMPAHRASEIHDEVLSLPDAGDIAPLVDLLAGAVGRALD